MKHHLRIIGDVHGWKERYLRLLRKAEYSLQIGDMDFEYDFLNSVDPDRHRFFGGNHDNYDEINDVPHSLGNHGIHTIPGFGDIFFVRGAYSIDQDYRTAGVSWWHEEELNYREAQRALCDYEKIKPDFVVTHSCPEMVVRHVTSSNWIKKTTTTSLLQAMLDIHEPKTWIFGHFHRSWKAKLGRTTFICLNELECLDLPKGNVDGTTTH